MRIIHTVYRTSVIVTTGRILAPRGSSRANTVTTTDTTIRLDGGGAVVIGHAVPLLLIGIIRGGLTAPCPEPRGPRTRVWMAPNHMSARGLTMCLIGRVPEDSEGR